MTVVIQPDGESEFLVKVTDVFLSYPHLFEPYRSRRAQLDDQGKVKQGKYGAKFCFDKKNPASKKDAQTIHAKIVEMAKRAFKQGLPADRYCLRDGAQLTEDMHGYYVLSASEDIKPTAVDRRRNPVADEDDLFYAGCKVNATIRLWVQDNSDFGKRINANLVGVQFLAHGERWGGRAKPKVEDMFDDIADQFDDDEYAGGPTGDAVAAGDDDDGFGDSSDGL
jgi:Protein of unknown function (DUF2815)